MMAAEYTNDLSWHAQLASGLGAYAQRSIQKINSEVGVLIETRLGGTMPRRLFVVMEFENKHYLGCLLFDDAPFGNQVNDVLKNHFGEPIKEIGDLDLSFLSYAPLHS